MLRRLPTLTATLVLAALGGCSGTDVLNAAAPRNTFELTRGIAYGRDPRQKLDVYMPTRAPDAADTHGRPVVVFFYGGSWQNGTRSDYLFVGEALASRGFVAVLPDYRTWPATGFPGFVDDAASAVRWARDHAAAFGGDPHRLFLMGHSAGAHIAVLLATDRRYLAAQQMSTHDLRGVIGLAGPYDFLPLQDPTLKAIFPRALRAASQPINFVRGGEPPMFLAAGRRDTMVDPDNTDRLAARLRAAGDTVEVKHYPRITHALLIGAFAAPLRLLAPVLDDCAHFIDTVSARAGASRRADAGSAAQAGAAAHDPVPADPAHAPAPASTHPHRADAALQASEAD
jgi:acetyl esterase/lipase